ncbi:protein TIC 100 [Andrographis paniculata]|uniref:protein TIC 100 n=1 Tax=Andrographis paniculata TaxID=175694 RepID=UPI0021E7E9E4|nr:protein TIC 100 [Andrographis paniculata]
MANPNAEEQPELKPKEEDSEAELLNMLPSSSSSSSSSDSDSDSDSKSDSESESDDEPISYVRPDGSVRTVSPYDSDQENTPEANISRFNKVLNSKRLLKAEEEEEEEAEDYEELFDFPPDPENWREEDLKELWADAPVAMTKPGWDPNDVDDDEVDILNDEIANGRDPPIAPFYVPYRKPYPVIPDNHHDISTPKQVIEELDRIEEFLTWVSYIFPDGSTYEGTVWDDLAHGRGVFVAEEGLVRYEGEWLKNDMEGHGVVEVEIPQPEPIPGSKLEAKMRAEGHIISRDYMTPEDREWLEMDIEDSLKLADGEFEVPYYENEEWVRQFGQKPEKGRYRYAGQWKHGRMHGCGVYEVNERITYGRFYFGELLNDLAGCDADISGMHAGIAEVAAAKARMFVNKPDGMVREYFGPYSDPQHPYFYEEEDVWMAPGFINQFYEVPDYWKVYVNEVDQEREMWLNSFYKAPLRLPMPSELEYWWANEKQPEFVLVNKEPEPDPENPDQLIYTEDPLIVHTPTGRIINYIDDEEHGIRLFWQPPLKEGEDIDPEKVEFLPLGFDEFYGRETEEPKDNLMIRFVKYFDNKTKPFFDSLQKWADEKKKASEERKELLKAELELAEAELSLKEAIEDMDEELKLMEKEEEKKALQSTETEDVSASDPAKQVQQTPPEAEPKKENEDEDEEEEEADEEDDVTPSSFGSVEDSKSTKNDDNSGKQGKSTFASTSLAFATSNLISLAPMKLLDSFSRWKQGKHRNQASETAPAPVLCDTFHHLPQKNPSTVSFAYTGTKNLRKLRCVGQKPRALHISKPSLRRHSKQVEADAVNLERNFNVLSLHTQVSPQPFSCLC